MIKLDGYAAIAHTYCSVVITFETEHLRSTYVRDFIVQCARIEIISSANVVHA